MQRFAYRTKVLGEDVDVNSTDALKATTCEKKSNGNAVRHIHESLNTSLKTYERGFLRNKFRL